MSDQPPKPPRKESTGAKKKQDRIVDRVIDLDLTENLTTSLTFLVQPSLKAAFVQSCQQAKPTPLNPSDVLRRLAVEFVENSKKTR